LSRARIAHGGGRVQRRTYLPFAVLAGYVVSAVKEGCVASYRVRIVMSSIMRRRRALIVAI